MKFKILVIATLIALSACGGSSKASNEMTATEEAVVLDSISTSIDEIKAEVKTETDQTVEEIDELLKDI